MFNHQEILVYVRGNRSAALLCTLLLLGCMAAFAQDQTPARQPSGSAPPQASDNGKPKQEVPADSGGPDGSVGPYAIPKKKADDAPPPPPPPPARKPEDVPDYSLKVNVPLVDVDVMVTTAKEGQFVPGLKKENFRVLEDGVPQQVTHFSVSQAS